MNKSKIKAQMLNDSTQPLLHKTDVSGSSIAGFQTPDKVCTYMSSFLPDKAGIDFTGIEIDKEYFDLAEKRFNNYKYQLNLF